MKGAKCFFFAGSNHTKNGLCAQGYSAVLSMLHGISFPLATASTAPSVSQYGEYSQQRGLVQLQPTVSMLMHTVDVHVIGHTILTSHVHIPVSYCKYPCDVRAPLGAAPGELSCYQASSKHLQLR